MTRKGISVACGHVWLSDTLYLISTPNDGPLSVSCATIDAPFTPVPLQSPPPEFRSKFSACAYDSTRILVIGGDGVGITSTEVWLFDTATAKFTQLTTMQAPIKRRSGHVACVNNGVCYVFGGTHGLDFCTDLLIVTVDPDMQHFSYKVIEGQPDWPAPRVEHTMTLMKDRIWLYGGRREDRVLISDLWELDFSLFPQHPKWTLIENKRVPDPRASHVSWNDNGMWVAGGLDASGHVRNEVWKYSGRWELQNIFECSGEICAVNGVGLLEVGETLKRAVSKNTFASLDLLFDKLKMRQHEYTDSVKSDFGALRGMRELDDLLRDCVKVLEKYIESGGREKDGLPRVHQVFSEGYRSKMAQDSRAVRESAASMVASIEKRFPEFIELEPCERGEELYVQLTLKLEQTRRNLDRLKRERMTEIELYRAHLSSLLGDRKTVSKLDPADYDTFVKATHDFPKSKQEYALAKFYRIQLRSYQILMEQTQKARAKLKKTADTKGKRTEMVNRLSDWLTTKFKDVLKADERLKAWNGQLDTVRGDVQQAVKFLEAVKEYQTNPTAVMSRIQQLEDENTKLRNIIDLEIQDLTVNRKAAMDALLQQVNALAESVKGKTANEARPFVDNEYPKIKEMAARIVPSVNVKK